jgi:hypothetical protein
MNELEESLSKLFRRDLSASELEAARAATPGEAVDGRKLKRIRRNAILAVRRKVNGHATRHWRRDSK